MLGRRLSAGRIASAVGVLAGVAWLSASVASSSSRRLPSSARCRRISRVSVRLVTFLNLPPRLYVTCCHLSPAGVSGACCSAVPVFPCVASAVRPCRSARCGGLLLGLSAPGLALLDATWCELLARLSLELLPWTELLPR